MIDLKPEDTMEVLTEKLRENLSGTYSSDEITKMLKVWSKAPGNTMLWRLIPSRKLLKFAFDEGGDVNT